MVEESDRLVEEKDGLIRENKTLKGDNKILLGHIDRLKRECNSSMESKGFMEREMRVIRSIYQQTAEKSGGKKEERELLEEITEKNK